MTLKLEDAKIVQEHALGAIRELSKTLNAVIGKCSEEEYERIKKAVGLSMGRIQIDILDVISSHFPELDDLKQPPKGQE